MLDPAAGAGTAKRGGLPLSARKSRRAGPQDRTILRASPNLAPAGQHAAIYWHRDLPPLDAEPIGEHVLEAASARVPHTMAYADELWNRCYEELMRNASERLEQEIARLDGDYAHVLEERVESKYSGATGESWLAGRFRYVLYRKPRSAPPEHSL